MGGAAPAAEEIFVRLLELFVWAVVRAVRGKEHHKPLWACLCFYNPLAGWTLQAASCTAPIAQREASHL